MPRSRRRPDGRAARRRPLAIGAAVAVAILIGVVGHALGTGDGGLGQAAGQRSDTAHGSAAAESSASPSSSAGSASPEARPSASAGRAQSSGKPSNESSGKPSKSASAASTELTVPKSGPRTYREADVTAKARGSRGRLIRYDVRVEKGVPVDPDQAARFIAATLNDERSWVGRGRWRFQLVSKSSQAELHASIATPGTTDKLCAPLLTRGKVSCQNGTRVVLNAERWVHGAASYGDHLTDYRHSLVNHEFGHYLGFGHVSCPGKGKLAPVMMQQTKGLDGCRRNPWPDPDR